MGVLAWFLSSTPEKPLGRYQFAQFAQDWFRFQTMHHRSKADRFHVHAWAGKAAVPKVLFDDSLPSGHISDDVANKCFVSYFKVCHFIFS
jgi:hypothetical protein